MECKCGKKIVDNNRDYPHSIKLTILYEFGILDEESFKRLNWFRKLRNDAAREAIFTITSDRLQLFAGTRYPDASHFPLLCMEIFKNGWNAYPVLFSSKFSPEGDDGIVTAHEVKGRTFSMDEGA